MERMDLEELYGIDVVRRQFPSTRPRTLKNEPGYCKTCRLPVHDDWVTDELCYSCGHLVENPNDYNLGEHGMCNCKCRCREFVQQAIEGMDSSDDEGEVLSFQILWTGVTKPNWLDCPVGHDHDEACASESDGLVIDFQAFSEHSDSGDEDEMDTGEDR